MIIGIVNAFAEATFNLPIQDADGTEQQVTVIIDTGYDGSLTLPLSLINALGLPFRSRGVAVLADGSEAQFNTYAATVIWDGQPRSILADAANTDPLIGMSLLYGHDIHRQAVDGGRVTVERLP